MEPSTIERHAAAAAVLRKTIAAQLTAGLLAARRMDGTHPDLAALQAVRLFERVCRMLSEVDSRARITPHPPD